MKNRDKKMKRACEFWRNLTHILLLSLVVAGCSIRPLYDSSFGNGDSFCDIEIAIIAERDGQKLRSLLMDSFRDMRFAKKNCKLTVNLICEEKGFGLSRDGSTNRVLLTYKADLVLKDTNGKVIMERKNIHVSVSYNTAHSHGSIMFSLYGRHNDSILRELCTRIVENVKVTIGT